MKRYYFLLSICVLLIGATLLSPILKRNLINVAYLPALFGPSPSLSQVSQADSCHLTWLKTAANSLQANYFIAPGEIEAILNCGQQYLSLLEMIQPINFEYASMAAAKYPKDAQAWFWLGETLQPSNPQSAIQAFTKVVKLDPSDALSWCRLGVNYENLGQPLEAVNAYLDCCYLGDPGANGCSSAGKMAEELGNPDKAIQYYRLSHWDEAQKRGDELENQLNSNK